MKRTPYQSKLHTLVAIFFLLGGLFLSANRAAAQSFNWMTESEALTVLATEDEQMRLDIQNFVPGSAPYKNVINHLEYYKLITVSINAGTSVERAVLESLEHVNDQVTSGDKLLPKNVLVQLFDDAVALLTN